MFREEYHIHCEFSDDSAELMEDQIQRALELGVEEICFTDHVDYGIKKDWDEEGIQYRSGGPGEPDLLPVANVDYPAYFAKLDKMKKLFGDRIMIKKGLEFGVQTITVPQFNRLYDRYVEQLDFVLLSMHQVDNREFWNQEYQKGKTQKEYNEGYYREILNTMNTFHHYSVLAHLDLIARYDQAGVYPFENIRDITAEILKQAIKDNKGIEMNTSSWKYGLADTTPSVDILKLYKDLGGKILTIGSDAHVTKYVNDHYDDAVQILKNIGFTEICTFNHMKPEFHTL